LPYVTHISICNIPEALLPVSLLALAYLPVVGVVVALLSCIKTKLARKICLFLMLEKLKALAHTLLALTGAHFPALLSSIWHQRVPGKHPKGSLQN
jgi:hypothetical protein